MRTTEHRSLTTLADAVDRSALTQHVLGPGNEANLAQLEAAIHPLVAQQRQRFLEEVRVARCCSILQFALMHANVVALFAVLQCLTTHEAARYLQAHMTVNLAWACTHTLRDLFACAIQRYVCNVADCVTWSALQSMNVLDCLCALRYSLATAWQWLRPTILYLVVSTQNHALTHILCLSTATHSAPGCRARQQATP